MINKAVLAQRIRKAAGVTYNTALLCVDCMTEAIGDTLAKGGRIELRGLGTFTVSAVAERKTSLNENALIPAHRRVAFRPCEKLRRAVWTAPEEQR
jgi:nucleoid DNA-binding protein